MFMHVSPESSMYGESVSTLNFARRVSEVALGQVRPRALPHTACPRTHVLGARSVRACDV